MFESNIKLNQLATVIDCEHKTAPTVDEGIPLIRTPDIDRGRLKSHQARRITEKTFVQWTRRAVPVPGDLIMAREAPVGNVGIVRKNERVCLGQRTVLIQPDRMKVCPEYLNYVFSTDALHAYMNMLATGATVGHLNVGDIRKLSLPEFPPIAAQQKIAAILTAYDDLIENNRQRIALLEKMAEEIYREWFVRLRFPGHEHTPVHKGVPEGWESTTLFDLCRLKRGYDLPKQNVVAGEYPILAATGIAGFHNAYKAAPPVVTTGRSGSLGAVVWSSKPSWPLNTALYVADDRGNSKHFLFYTLKSANLAQFNSGAGVPTLNRNHLSCVKVSRPPREIQRRFDSIASTMRDQVDVLQQSTDLLTETRDLLLNRLISGKLRVDNLDIQFPPSMQDEAA